MKYITNYIKVNDHFRFFLADNGKNGDALISLFIAPIIADDTESILYLETNGDPVLIGSIELDKIEKGENGILYLENDQPWWDEVMGDFDIDDQEDFEELLIGAGLIK